MKNIGKTIAVTLCLLAAGTVRVKAVPAYPYPLEYVQSDGTRLTVRIIGDEFLHYTLSEEGYTLTGGPDGDLYYATLSRDGQLLPTAVKARPLAQLAPAERVQVSKLVKGIRPVMTAEMKQRMRSFRTPTAVPSPAASAGIPAAPGRISSAPTTGRVRSLILLAEYPSKRFVTPSPQQAFTDLLMKDGYSDNGAMGSAWNYYHDNSNGRFDPEFVVVGPYKLSHNSDYYAGSSGTVNVAEMIAEVCKLADADVNFADFADNGVIRDVFVFFAGQGRAAGGDGTTVWPHRWDVRGDYRYQSYFLDGVQLVGYACSCELNSDRQMDGIGTFCHEFGHVLGWPDFYDTDYEGSGGTSPALGTFSLMCSGSYNNNSHTPPALNILERWMVGWAEPQPINGGGAYTLDPVWEDKGYIVQTPTTNDYFLMECRAVDGFIWDQYLTDDSRQPIDEKGLLVYHVDYTSPYQNRWIYSNDLNANPSHECMKRVYAYKNGSKIGYFYPGNHDVTELSPEVNPLYTSWKKAIPNVSFRTISLRGNRVRLEVPGDLPELDFQADVHQYDALLSWNGEAAPTWNVSWKTADGKVIGNTSVSKPSCLITGLEPATTYEVGITPVDGSVGEVEQTFSLTTQSRNGNRQPHISVPAGGFKAGEPFVLSLLDASGDVSSVVWYIDSQPTEGHVTLDVGEYAVKALVLTPKGDKFYLMKYITVK